MNLKTIYHQTDQWALDRDNALIREALTSNVYVVPPAVAALIANEYRSFPSDECFDSLCRLAILVTQHIPLEQLI